MFSNLFGNRSAKKNIYFGFLSLLILWFICVNVDIAFMFFASIAFACALAPLVDKLSEKMSRTWAATIVLVGLLVILALFIIPIFVLGIYQIGTFASAFPSYVDNLDDVLKQLPIAHSLGIDNLNTDEIMNAFATSSADTIDIVMDFVKGISSAFLYIFTSIIFLFFLLADKKAVKGKLLKMFPAEMREKTAKIFKTISEKLGGYVVAQAVVSGSVWVTMTLGLLLFGINYAFILGLIAGVLSIIPVVGSGLSLVICLIATYEAGIKSMIIVAVLFTISHFIENHVVRPYVYSKFLSLHPIIIFLALFIGAKYAGVTGVIFAPPIAMALCILLDELYMNKMDEQQE